MELNGYEFVFFFLPLTIALFHLAPAKSRLAILAAANILFYSWWNVKYSLLLLLSAFLVYLLGLGISHVRDTSTKRWLLFVAVAANLCLLGYLKYVNFFLEAFRQAFGMGGLAVNVLLPLGASVYTFKCISYAVDVYRGMIEPVGPLKVFCYVALFPQLTAGPIDRPHSLIPQMANVERSLAGVAHGMTLFIYGLVVKVVIADNLVGYVPRLLKVGAGFLPAWFGLLVYSLYIYLDFAAYSTMAIGVGRALGLSFQRNFDRPYLADGLRDFWRRWHISLSLWLREYLYFPLGGSRGGRARTAANLLIVMLVCGLWHGAKWTFLAWGAYHGVGLVAERIVAERFDLSRAPHILRQTLTFITVSVGWVFFYASDMGHAYRLLAALAGVGGVGLYLMRDVTVGALVLVVVGALVCRLKLDPGEESFRPTPVAALGVAALLLVGTVFMLANAGKPFLYARF